jgi:hypothetical protein
MQLAPHTASSREPARCAETNVYFRVGGRARPPFTANEQMPIVAALAGGIVEGHLDNRRSAEQFRMPSLMDCQPRRMPPIGLSTLGVLIPLDVAHHSGMISPTVPI